MFQECGSVTCWLQNIGWLGQPRSAACLIQVARLPRMTGSSLVSVALPNWQRSVPRYRSKLGISLAYQNILGTSKVLT